MAVLAVVTSSPPAVEGGHLVIARALVAAARDAGHDARLVVTPDFGFGRLTASYLANWRTDVNAAAGAAVDQMISFRYPSFAVRHEAHVNWHNHTMREYYDLWPRFSASISPANRLKEGMRRAVLRRVDGWLLRRHVTRVVAQSETIRRRLHRELAVAADVVWPPAPPRPYRCDGYGDEILAVSRLTPLKRIDLLIRALADPAARSVRVVVAGDGEQAIELERLARELGVDARVRFIGRADDAMLVEQLSRCRAVCFPPYDEDYGFVTIEAFASHKAVVTCRDSGGPTELVRDGETGLVCDPTPGSLAAALARLAGDRVTAERMGAAAAEIAARITWHDAVSRLLIV